VAQLGVLDEQQPRLGVEEAEPDFERGERDGDARSGDREAREDRTEARRLRKRRHARGLYLVQPWSQTGTAVSHADAQVSRHS